MKNSDVPLLSEGLLTLAIVVALVLLINPFSFLMTSAFTLTLLMVLGVAMIAFGVFVWREKPRDEREALYGLRASRVSYFMGAAVLVVAIITQAFHHTLDIWLAVALGAMVLTKLVVSGMSRNR